MDIPRPELARKKKMRRIGYVAGLVILVLLVTIAVSKLRPAAPTVDGGTLYPDTVKRGEMLRQVRGLGTLVPEDIRWIPASTQGRVERIILHPGANVKPDAVILELSNLDLEQQLVDSEMAMKKSEAEMANLRVQLESQLMTQRSQAAQVESDYTTARLQAERDEALLKLQLVSELNYKIT